MEGEGKNTNKERENKAETSALLKVSKPYCAGEETTGTDGARRVTERATALQRQLIAAHPGNRPVRAAFE